MEGEMQEDKQLPIKLLMGQQEHLEPAPGQPAEYVTKISYL